MIHSISRLIGLFFGMLILFYPISGTTTEVVKQSDKPIQVFGVAQQDLDGDHLPDVTIIDCSFATERDQVLVYDRTGNMQDGNRWEEMTDFEDDIWIFDAGADGSAQLIIAFALEDGNQTAYLYVDDNHDGQVSYELNGKEVYSTDSPHWLMKVVAQGAWLLPDGRHNPNITMFVDGTIIHLTQAFVALAKGEWTDENLKTDGKIDWEKEIGDQDSDGEADYHLTRLLTEIPDHFNAYRSQLLVDKDLRPAVPYTNSVFWPLLIGSLGAESGLYFDHPPVVTVDWETGSIDRAGILGFPTEQGYHIMSSAPTWQKGRVNDVLFENPLAYYDLANDLDHSPELLIRVVHPIWLNSIPSRPIPADMLHVEYTWDQNNDGKWDYVVSGAGRKPILQTIDFPDFAIRTVPYEKLPSWASGETWDAAFFVVGEAGGRGDNESLWVWDFAAPPPNNLESTYLSGYSDAPPPGIFQKIQVGYRGEYSLEYFRQPLLYFSPIDRKLHLVNSQEGVWNLDGEHEIRYVNTLPDDYVDAWQYFAGGMLQRRLISTSDHLVYSGENEIVIKNARVAPALFKTLPPRDHQEWSHLGQLLAQHQRDFAPDDFKAMVEQFSGPALHLEGASLRNFRHAVGGFRAVLDLQEGFRVLSDPDGLLNSLNPPGEYLLEYHGSEYQLHPMTPASLSLGDSFHDLQVGNFTELGWASLGVEIRNRGLQDLFDLPVCAVLLGPNSETMVISDTLELVPGEGHANFTWDWLPPAAGEWDLSVISDCNYGEFLYGQLQVIGHTNLIVKPREIPTFNWLLSLGGILIDQNLILLAIFLTSLIILGGGVMIYWMHNIHS